MNSEFYRGCLAYARGEVPADFVIRNATVANVFSLEYEKTDVAVARGIVVGLGNGYEGIETIDAAGKVLIPGMMDAHLHIESTMMTPLRFAEAVVPRGTSAVMADPHEIANVWGPEGIMAMRENALELPLDFFWGASSCVPASDFETCREPIDATALKALLETGTCQHLGEMMNFPAVIAGGEDVWNKIAAAWDRPLTGHAPGVSGKDLCAYLLSGCIADHETFSYAEGLEKLRRGGWVMMRAGSAACDLSVLAPLVIANAARSSRCMAVSDDLSPVSILAEGHMDAKMRMMCQLGIDPLIALRMVTLSPAEYFMLPRRGGIAPGWMADLALVDSLESCRVDEVWKQGRLVAKGGRFCGAANRVFPQKKSMPAPPIHVEDLQVPAPPIETKIRVIGWQSGSLMTESLCLTPRIENGFVAADPERDIAKLVVQERNKNTGRINIGFVSGMGLQFGALGASVAHDAHPFIVAGADDVSILRALDWLRENGGGFVVCEGEQVLAALPLPIGGLMSDDKLETVAAALGKVDAAASDLGITGAHPCMALSFLSLSVIPSLKLTDQGYVDIGQGGRQELFKTADEPAR